MQDSLHVNCSASFFLLFMFHLMDCMGITGKQRVAEAQFSFRDLKGLFLYFILELEVNYIKIVLLILVKSKKYD